MTRAKLIDGGDQRTAISCQFCHRSVSAELVAVTGYASARACPECAGRLDLSTWPARRIVERFRRHWDGAHGQPGALAKILVVEGSPEFQKLIEECAGQ